MLKRLNITSFEFITQQYDHIVLGNLVLGPLQGRGRINAECSVIRPVLDSQKGVIMSQGMYPTYSDIDTYHMAAASLDTAVRNAVAAGANPDYLALLDNFCWCSSNEPERLGQLKHAAKACYDYAVAYGTPYISLDAKNPEDVLYLLGETKEELGGSEYYAMHNAIGNTVPTVDAEKNKKLYNALYSAIQQDLINSSISLTRGGLGVALAKKAIGGMLGAEIDLKKIPGEITRDDYALYSETQGRILVTVAKENKDAFEKEMRENAFAEIGKITQTPNIIIHGLKGGKIINIKLTEATEAYRETLKDY